ncbi:ABC transporter substrate-binding protein [Bradyrhizobium sp. CCBAU 51627]|nr:ABC transporter substrate-binding protein [Bradyrhizobium sp. CCBAU 51627]
MLASVLASGPAFAQGGTGQASRTLKMVPHAVLRLLDPVGTSAYITRNHGYLIYDTLFGFDEKFRPQPQMVGNWNVSGDGLVYTFTLRDGLRFHDGAPVTSDDCIASLSRWMKSDMTGERLARSVKEMVAVDTKTFKIVLSASFASMLEALAKPSTNVPFIMPKRVVEAADKGAGITDTTGSGPFKFVASEFRPGIKVVYERNADYVPRSEPASYLAGGKIAKLDRIEWLTFPDIQTVVNAIKKGDIDLVEWVTADTLTLLRGAPGLEIQKLASANCPFLRMNWLYPPFDNVKIRQAAQLAVSQRDVMDAVVGDQKAYEVCGALFGCGSPLETNAASVGVEKADPAKAKALLKEAGYKGEPVVFINPGDLTVWSAVSSVTSEMLKAAGFNVDFQTMDFATLLARRNRQTPPAEGGWNIMATINSTLDLYFPLSNVNLDGRGKSGYSGWSSDSEMEALKETFAKASDPADQKAIAEKIQKRAYEQVHYIPLGMYNNFSIRRSNVSPLLAAPVTVYWGLEKSA